MLRLRFIVLLFRQKNQNHCASENHGEYLLLVEL